MKWIFSRFYGHGWNGYFLDSIDMDEMDILNMIEDIDQESENASLELFTR